MRTPKRLPLALAGLLAAALLLGACTSMTGEDDNRLALHLENAAQYYDTGHYERAYQQWDRALEIDPQNVKGRLGQAFALYQMGLVESPEGVERLSAAEERMRTLAEEGIGDQTWKAHLGQALVQQRWIELLDRKLERIASRSRVAGTPEGPEEQVVHAEVARRVPICEQGFRAVLEEGEGEPTDQLTCWVGLARLAARRGDLEAALEWARRYERQVVNSKKLWRDSIERFPREAPVYEAKLFGAEQQEAALRDALGNVLFKLGRLEEAEAELDELVALQPARATAYLNRGVVRSARRDWDLARSDFRRFLALSDLAPDDPVVVEAAQRLVEAEEQLALEDERMQGPPAQR